MNTDRPKNPTEAQSLTDQKGEPTRIGIAIVQWKGRFLVGTRSSEQVLGGMAEFPGGKCEPGESADQCAIRECLEETGLTVRVVEQLKTKRHEYPHGRLELAFFRCEPVDEPGEPCGSFRWIERGELSKLNFPEANADVVQSLA